MTTLHDAVVQHLRAQHIDANADADAASGRATFTVEMNGGSFQVECTSNAEGRLVVRSTYPNHIAAIDLPAVEELLTRANATLTMGNFDVRRDDATVQYRTSIDFAGTEPSPELVGRVIGVNLAAMVRWIPAIASVANGLPVEMALEGTEPEP